MTPGKIPEVPAIGDADQPPNVLRPILSPPSGGLPLRMSALVWRSRTTIPRSPFPAALGFDSINAGTVFNGQALQAIGGGALRWRLFDFGKVKAEIAQARGAYAEALVAYRQTALKAREAIENAMMELAQY
jgi:hypothetical protein